MAPPTLAREAACWAAGRLLVGVDEVGRGPLAGPVVAAAVVFPPGCRPIPGVRDSKVVPPGRRAALAAEIRLRALAVAVAAASRGEVDRLNIRVATALAMRRAVLRLVEGRGSRVEREGFRLRDPSLDPQPSTLDLLLDGLPLPELGLPHDALVDGDALCHSVAAAGIVAKVVRDELMLRLHRRHPGYGWDTNAGYGTAEHRAALARLGPTPHHRLTFAPLRWRTCPT
ncbi:MAG TPA: ribonuclease HII [Gemmatimonadales bacterium]|nr:ribonuclease HII [Gemmatimonadales bacterium]